MFCPDPLLLATSMEDVPLRISERIIALYSVEYASAKTDLENKGRRIEDKGKCNTDWRSISSWFQLRAGPTQRIWNGQLES